MKCRLRDDRDNRDDLYDTSVGWHGFPSSWPFIGHDVSEANQYGVLAIRRDFEGMGSEIPIKCVRDTDCDSNLYHKAYLAMGGKTSSKMSRSKFPTGQILAAAENLAFAKRKVVTLYRPSDSNKALLEESGKT